MDQLGEAGYGDFRAFVTARLGALSRVAYLLTADHHAAENLLQDTLVRVASRWSQVSSANDPMAPITCAGSCSPTPSPGWPAPTSPVLPSGASSSSRRWRG